jgi:CheY-like chemotaxis protein
LAISKALVEILGGEMGIETEEGAGSTFWFTLSCGLSSQSGRQGGSADETPDLPPGKVALVVEDSQVMRLLAVKQLGQLGVVAHAVSDGYKAVEQVTSKNFDVILIDCHLPGIDGFDTAIEIRKIEQKQGRRTPIIAITAAATQSDRAHCLETGMDDYLCKPVSITELKQKLHVWMSGKK